MKPALFFIAPEWTAELEELLQITKESFAISVLTEKQDLDFNDPYIEILQCFETYSFFEIAKMLPWLIQRPSPHFHLLLPASPKTRQLSGVGTLLTMLRALPGVHITYAERSTSSLGFTIWLKSFRSIFDGPIPCLTDRLLVKSQPHQDELTLSSNRELQLMKYTWVFPSLLSMNKESQGLIHAALSCKENIVEFWNWQSLPIRKQNQMRNQFLEVWEQIRTHTVRKSVHDWEAVHFLVLVGPQDISFSEMDLLDLVIEYNLSLVLDPTNRSLLKGPWKDGENFWLWHPTQIDNEDRPWSNPHRLLPFTSKADLKLFRDELSNQVLRSFIRLDFQS